MADKKFIDGFFTTEKQSQFGNFMTVSILIPKFAEFVKKFKADNPEQKYININIFPVKEPKEKGNTHYAVLNEYKAKEEKKEEVKPEPPLTDDMPF